MVAISEFLKRAVDRADRKFVFLSQTPDLFHRDPGRIKGIHAEPATGQEKGVAALAAADIENRLREVEEVDESNQRGLGLGAEVIGGRTVENVEIVHVRQIIRERELLIRCLRLLTMHEEDV